MLLFAVVLCIWLQPAWGFEGQFPSTFKFGAASASYQVEGAWNADDKSESIWDVLTHNRPDLIADGSTGDVACDSYHQWERDIEIAAELGLDFYRFSISWPRLLPTGFPNNISEAGTKYYNNLIDGLLARGIEPVVTLYHWDLPNRLQDLGGWTNPLITDWFEDYARVAFSLFGDRVKSWITMNEPIVVCDFAYNSGMIAPLIKDPGIANLICNKNILVAHAKAYRVYKKDFRSQYKGEVGITNHFIWFEPESEEYEDLAEMVRQLCAGMYSHAIYSKEGGWPKSIEKLIADKSKMEGYPYSRLPAFTKEEKKLVRGSFDFLGFNLYTGRIVRTAELGEVLSPWPLFDAPELNARLYMKSEWPRGASTWFAVYPESIRNMLAWVKKQYGDVKILITENGYSARSKSLNDVERIDYYKAYLEQVLLSIKEDGVNVVGYTAWTLFDNFEWSDGYTANFGLYNVDFTDPTRPRTSRASARYYANVIRERSFNVTFDI